MSTSFINNILNSQPILIKFALKLFVFSDTFTSWSAFSFKTDLTVLHITDIIYVML